MSDEVLRLFNLDTEEDDFDGFSAQEDDERGYQFPGRLLSFFFFNQPVKIFFVCSGSQMVVCQLHLNTS